MALYSGLHGILISFIEDHINNDDKKDNFLNKFYILLIRFFESELARKTF